MKKPWFAQAMFNLFDIQSDSLSNYAASESRRSNNKVWMFDDNGDAVYKGSEKHREMHPEDFEDGWHW
jgi:hypothetical protein